MSEEECKDEGFNVATVDIRVTHDHNFVVAKFLDIQALSSSSVPSLYTERCIDVLDLFILKHFVVHRFLHV